DLALVDPDVVVVHAALTGRAVGLRIDLVVPLVGLAECRPRHGEPARVVEPRRELPAGGRLVQALAGLLLELVEGQELVFLTPADLDAAVVLEGPAPGRNRVAAPLEQLAQEIQRLGAPALVALEGPEVET